LLGISIARGVAIDGMSEANRRRMFSQIVRAVLCCG
jgi:hypothetical protein